MTGFKDGAVGWDDDGDESHNGDSDGESVAEETERVGTSREHGDNEAGRDTEDDSTGSGRVESGDRGEGYDNETMSQGQTSSSEAVSDEESETVEGAEGAGSSRLPWIHARNSITDGRERTVQLHLQRSTITQERDVLSDVQSVLGENVAKADLREAALLVGLSNFDAVTDQLREWGYDY